MCNLLMLRMYTYGCMLLISIHATATLKCIFSNLVKKIFYAHIHMSTSKYQKTATETETKDFNSYAKLWKNSRIIPRKLCIRKWYNNIT